MSQREMSPADATNLPSVSERTRRPFTNPTGSLSVPEIPGYHLHWFLGDPQRMQRAIQAGYEHVDASEIVLNNHSLGSDSAAENNTDMGSRVSVPAKGVPGPDNQPMRMYLMKIKEEWWLQDQAALTAPGSRLEGVRQALVAGQMPANAEMSSQDKSQVYVDSKRTKLPEFLQRKKA